MRYVAFLRGVNVGPSRRVSKDELRRAFEDLGFEDVATFRTSGNVIFDVSGRAGAAALVERIEQGLGEAVGFEVWICLRTAREIEAIHDHEPFRAEAVAAGKGKLQVAFLLRKPTASATKQVLAQATDKDQLAIDGTELYWLPAGGTLESDLDLKRIDGLVGPWTMRTKGTVDLIAEKFCAG